MNNTDNNHSVNISWASVWRFYAVLFLFLAIWFLRQIIFIILVSFVLASLLDWPINKVEKKLHNRWQATLLVYIIGAIVISLLIYLALPVFSNYLQDIQHLLPSWLTKDLLHQIWQGDNNSLPISNWGQWLGFSQGQISIFFRQVTNIFSRILGSAFSAVLVLILSFFINTERKGIEKALRLISPARYEEYIVHVWKRAQRKVGDWFFSQLILSLMVGILTLISFEAIGIPRAPFLAILAGLLDFIPYVGPLLAGVIAFFAGAGQSWLLAVMAIGIFGVIQGLEAFVAPELRAKAMKLNPIIIIIALLIGGKLAGVIGAIIALPLAATIVEVLNDLHSGRFEINT